MNSTPLTPGSFISVELTDENDPVDGSMTALLVQPEGSSDEWPELANSFGADDRWFMWLVESAATFHNLPVQFDPAVPDNRRQK